MLTHVSSSPLVSDSVFLATLRWLLPIFCLLPASLFAQGPLTPPGAPAPTFKTLSQIEPRTPIGSAPFSISSSGSYYLTTNLSTTSTSAIDVQANDVSLDLMGFFVTAGTNGHGVSVGASRRNVVIHNGIIRNCRSNGVSADTVLNVQVFDLLVVSNNGVGILTGDNALVRNCTVVSNASSGISVGNGSLISGCTAVENGLHGIAASAKSTILDCNVSGSSANGINILSCAVVRCTVRGSAGHGINSVSEASSVSDCLVFDNTLDGIRVVDRSLVLNNNVNGTGFAVGTNACIHVTGTGNRVEGNMATTHQRGIFVENTENLIIRNFARLNGTNYNIISGNGVGPLVIRDSVGTDTSPHANFNF